MNLEGKRVLVFGAGRSGIAAAKLLQKLDAAVVLYEENKNTDTASLKDKLDTGRNFKAYFGNFPDQGLDRIDLMILSPGISAGHPFVMSVKKKGIPVWGELELAFRNSRGKVIAITGTNGKTTTTSLTGEIMRTYFKEVFVAGNIGKPYSDIALETTDESVSVIEVSSFQLETIYTFRPNISAILNITPDHLDRHHTMDNYIGLKKDITRNQNMDDLCILNYDDENIKKIADRIKTRIMYFSGERQLKNGLYLDEGDIVYARDGHTEKICNVNELKILGRHNYENVMAGVGIAVSMGIPAKLIYKAVTSFKGVEHRIEYVDTINGVKYYNDSKGTNPDAAIKAVRAMNRPTILIGGGYDKGVTFDNWIMSFEGKIKTLVLLGQTAEKIAETARKYGFYNIIMAKDLKEAVTASAKMAVPGDAVLLSPACASWDMFESYEERGKLFKEYVYGLRSR
jgi:UDP-N-acetylmuramoylalanine--D-glutamate ligase (EC 6.3.2.9)